MAPNNKRCRLPISQAINALSDVKAADKPLLADVCGLFHNGGKGVCNPSNKYLAARMGEACETISRRLNRLAAGGWLAIDPGKENGFARTIAPAQKLLALYLPVNSPLLTKSIAPIDQINSPLLTETALPIDQTSNSLLIVKDEQDEQTNEQDEQPAALALAEKKIEALGFELAEALQNLNACRATITSLRAELENEKKKGGATRVPTSVSRLPFPTEDFAATWEDFRLTQGIAANSARERVLFKDLMELAPTEADAVAIVTQSIRKNWKSFFKLDTPKPHANASNATQPTSRYHTTRHPGGFGSFAAASTPRGAAAQPVGGASPGQPAGAVPRAAG